MKWHPAPWSNGLKLVSTFGTVLLLVIAAILSRHQPPAHSWIALLFLLILVGCALFTVRGYALSPDALLVQRLLWQTSVSLSGLQSVEAAPDVMARSIRIIGNGGLYSYSGRFRNRALGTYRAFVTDSRRTVILRFQDRTVVISPGDPEAFVAELKTTKDFD